MVEGRESDGSGLWLLASGLAVYSVLLTVLTGDIGFDADDWWIFSWAYWYSFPESLVIYAREALRPVEGVYWLGLFELVGFDRPVFLLFSLVLGASAAFLMGVAMLKAFPESRLFAVLSTLIVFFLPTVSSLTYIIFTDNSRLSLLLFWASVLVFQAWAEKSASWLGLILPVLLYVISFLTYEAPSLLILAVPLMVWPVWSRRQDRPSFSIFALRIGAAIITGFAVAAALRFELLNGGAVGQRHVLPPLDLIFSYLGLLPFYLVAPFSSLCREPWVCALACAVCAWVACLMYSLRSVGHRPTSGNSTTGGRGVLFKIGLGIVILFLGMLPYQLAGYGSVTPRLFDTMLAKWGLINDGDTPWFNFNWASRIYSSASYGIAIIAAALLTAWKNRVVRIFSQVAVVLAIGFMAAFHAGLSLDWKEAATIRNDLVQSLVRQVPDVKPETNFVFLDLESYHKRAAVVRRWGGLRELIRMLYDDRTLGAWYLYPFSWEPPNKIFQQAIVLTAGFVSRGMKLDAPAPHDSLLLMKRSGRKLELMDRIACDDGTAPTGISWRGAYSLHSNRTRILNTSSFFSSEADSTRRRWIRSLMSALRLSVPERIDKANP